QTRRDAPAQGQVGGDEGAGLARILQSLAHHQGDGGGGVLLGADGDDRQPLQPLGDRVGGAGGGGPGAQVADGVAPVGGGVGGTQGLVQQALAGAAPDFAGGVFGGLEPGAHGLARRLRSVQQPPQGVLGMLLAVAQSRPDRRVQIPVQTGQDDAAARRSGDGGQNIGGGGGG